MFIHNLDPVLMQIGPIAIRYYSLVYIFGVLITMYLLSKKTDKVKNLSRQRAENMVIWGTVAGLVGARLFHVLSEIHLYIQRPLEIFAIWQGGLGFFGGLLGGIIFGVYYCRKHDINVWQIFDIVVIPLPLIIGLGRLANFINSEHVGFAADVPWCVVFPRVDMLCRHPAQIYEAISMFLLFGAVLLAYRLWKKKSSATFWVFITAYGIARFITDFFRAEQSFYLLGLSHTQFLSLGMVMAGIFMLIRAFSKNHR
jgi:phosphatidylglycerol---prolipoprotein diacylglyceryl transferase